MTLREFLGKKKSSNFFKMPNLLFLFSKNKLASSRERQLISMKEGEDGLDKNLELEAKIKTFNEKWEDVIQNLQNIVKDLGEAEKNLTAAQKKLKQNAKDTTIEIRKSVSITCVIAAVSSQDLRAAQKEINRVTENLKTEGNLSEVFGHSKS